MNDLENLAKEISQRARQAASMGDKAARFEKVARDRRSQRRLQSLNKAARACETATEASGRLLAIVQKGMMARKISATYGQKLAHRFLSDTDLLTDDLYYEACVIGSYQPQPRAKKKGRK